MRCATGSEECERGTCRAETKSRTLSDEWLVASLAGNSGCLSKAMDVMRQDRGKQERNVRRGCVVTMIMLRCVEDCGLELDFECSGGGDAMHSTYEEWRGEGQGGREGKGARIQEGRVRGGFMQGSTSRPGHHHAEAALDHCGSSNPRSRVAHRSLLITGCAQDAYTFASQPTQDPANALAQTTRRILSGVEQNVAADRPAPFHYAVMHARREFSLHLARPCREDDQDQLVNIATTLR